MDPVSLVIIGGLIVVGVIALSSFLHQLINSRDKKTTEAVELRATESAVKGLEKVREDIDKSTNADRLYQHLDKIDDQVKALNDEIRMLMEQHARVCQEYSTRCDEIAKTVSATPDTISKDVSAALKQRDQSLAVIDAKLDALREQRTTLLTSDKSMTDRLFTLEDDRRDKLVKISDRHTEVISALYSKYSDNDLTITGQVLANNKAANADAIQRVSDIGGKLTDVGGSMVHGLFSRDSSQTAKTTDVTPAVMSRTAVSTAQTDLSATKPRPDLSVASSF